MEVKYKLWTLGIAEGFLFIMRKVQSMNHRVTMVSQGPPI